MSIRAVISRQQRSKMVYGALYINLALSSKENFKAEGYGLHRASRALRKVNAKVRQDDATVSTRSVYQP